MLDSANSTALNTSRLEILRAREEQLQVLFDDAKKDVQKLSEDKESYEKVVAGLITEVSKGDS